jgi:hypothetical protein
MKTSESSVVYAYHVPSLRAIKIGYGDDAELRMRSYRKDYKLTVDEASLREYKVPSRSIAVAIESACHRAAIEAGLVRVNHEVEGKEAQELFALGSVSVSTAMLLVAGVVEEEITRLHKMLGELQPKSTEKARQRRETARLRISEERAAQKAELERNSVICAKEIDRKWNVSFSPLIESVEKGKRHFERVIDPPEGFIQGFFKKRLFYPEKILISPHLPTIVPFIEDAFHKRRKAREAYIELQIKYGLDVIVDAQERCGKNVWQPLSKGIDDYGGNHIKTYGPIGEVIDIAKYIVGLDTDSMRVVVYNQTGLMTLVRFAEENPRKPDVVERNP